MGNILIKGLRIFAYHGVNSEEKKYGQTFELDIKAETDMSNAYLSDRIEDTVSYSAVVKTAKRVFSLGSDNLLERAAYRVAQAVMTEFQQITKIIITLKKPDAPMKSDLDYVGISVSFDRSDFPIVEQEQYVEADNGIFSEVDFSKNEDTRIFTFK